MRAFAYAAPLVETYALCGHAMLAVVVFVSYEYMKDWRLARPLRGERELVEGFTEHVLSKNMHRDGQY
jgi:hypothetical protein